MRTVSLVVAITATVQHHRLDSKKDRQKATAGDGKRWKEMERDREREREPQSSWACPDN